MVIPKRRLAVQRSAKHQTFMGDHLKRIPLSRFTQGQTGDYINTITSDVNNYEKILTHKIGDLAKSFALSLMLIIFVMTIYVPAGIILLIADLLLIPGLWLSFRMVRKYGKERMIFVRRISAALWSMCLVFKLSGPMA